MPKRKRDYDILSKEGDPSKITQEQEERLKQKIFHHRKLLQRSLKTARGLERQKLGKRRKAAVEKGDEADLKRLDAEIQAVKTVDLALTAETHLHKTILKDKALNALPMFSPDVLERAKVVQDIPTANVTARLYNSKPVKETMSDIMTGLKRVAGIRESHVGKRELSMAMPYDTQSQNAKDVTIREIDSDKDYSKDDDDEHKAVDRSFDSRVASSSDEESSDGGQENDDNKAVLENERPPSADIISSLAPSYSPIPTRREVERAKDTQKTSEASFLPSLTLGGYLSGSEDGSLAADDWEDNVPRKNRRGQRARQQIWEKKYGNNAKHLTKQRTSKKDLRDEGWDLKRGAQPRGKDVFGRSGHLRHKSANKFGRFDADEATGVTKGRRLAENPRQKETERAAGKPLHPSWEAAKKAREQKQTETFAGKKVVFD